MLFLAFPARAQQENAHEKMLSEEQLLALAHQYKYGIGRDANHKEAANIYAYLTLKGNAIATNEMGICLMNGDGVQKNPKAAHKLFARAARQGNLDAICNIALIYQQGRCGSVNYKKAYSLYRKAAELGSVHGLYGAGYMLYKGFGVEQSYEEAIKLLEQGAAKGHPGCSLLLASYYANGYDKERDMEKAEKYWGKASRDRNGCPIDEAKSGWVDAINNRISRKNTWKYVRNRVLKDETMPEIKSTVDAHNIEGEWFGKVYSYDWSRKNIVDEKDIKMSIMCDDDSVRIGIYTNDSLSTSYAAVLKGNKYVSKDVTSEQLQYSWTVTRTLFDTRDNYLFADLRVFDHKTMSVIKPTLAVLSREEGGDSDVDNGASTFSIASVQYKSGVLNVEIEASKSMNVDITASNVAGVVKLPSYRAELHSGHNILTVPVLFENSDVAVIITVLCKNERHSKTITVRNRE